MILVIRLTKEQNLALVTRYPMEIFRAGIEQGVQGIADTLIEEEKIRGLLEKEKQMVSHFRWKMNQIGSFL